MKSPIILVTLFAGSLAAVPLPGLDILPPLPVDCMAADVAIQGGLAVARPMLPDSPRMEDAIEAGIAAFKHKIKCGPAPPEPKAVPADEQMDCSGKVDDAIEVGRGVLRAGFTGAPAGYNEGVREGIRVFKKTLGCEEQAEVMVRDI